MGQQDNNRLADQVNAVKEMIQPCIQCGTCTGSCPNSEFMDITPRHMWRMVLMDRVQDIFKSRSFIMCSSCYYCTLRCPRGLELTHAMNLLKQAASKAELGAFRRSTVFYRAFLDNVREHGRLREMQFMTRYFISMKNPVIPLQFAPLGLKLMAKKKIRPDFSSKGRGKLSAIFEKVAQLEE